MLRPSMAHDASPEAFAEAMIRCQGYAPACSDQGECDRDGDCFRSEKRCVIEARRAILAAAEGLIPDVADLVRDAARMLVSRHNREVGAIADEQKVKPRDDKSRRNPLSDNAG